MKALMSAAIAALSTLVALGAPLRYTVVNDHADLIYRTGETASFTVTATDTNGVKATEGTVDLWLDNFGAKNQLRERIDLARTNPFTVKGRLDESGFLRLRLMAKDTPTFDWSVGYDPTGIRKGSPSPADFDAFWAAARARLAKEVPLDAQVVRVPERCHRDFEYYRISFATFGRRVYGYMSVPTDKARAPYPVEFSVSAAGFGGWTNDMSGDPARIKVFFSVYPFEPNWKWRELGLKETTYDRMNADCKAKHGTIYSQAGIAESREAYFFYPVILGIDRAVDWVAARPDVDRTRFCYQGTSQGGGFGFYLTGLNHTFTRAAFFVPAITDTMGYLKDRQSGWPSIVESQRKENRAAAERNAPYFDGANFASRIRCPVRVGVGFSDTTCAPCAVYAAYNEIKVADKAIRHGFGMTHSVRSDVYEELMGWLHAPRHAFEIGEKEFLLDGRPFQIRCGEMHLARIPRAYWRHRIRMCRAMGLNAVCAYLFWNNHEQTPGAFDFTGDRDAAEFCRIAQQEGMWVMLRPGPYVCAEWEFGGLPWWLLDKGEEGVKVRSTDPKYLEPAKRYLREVGKVLAPLQVTRGGPILMVQVENEYGSYAADPEYMRAMYRAARDAGFEVPLFACNGPSQLPNGRIPELFDVVNFGGDPAGCFKELRKYRKTGPLMNGEYYPGWFDTWGKAHHTKKFDAVIKEIGWMLENRASFSIYMAHGGTTFGWWAGCNTPYQPQAPSYDYEAPISEAGHVTDKFFGIRDLCAKHLNPGETIPEPPKQIPVAAFAAAGRAAVAPLAGAKEVALEAPTTFERLGLGYGIGVFRRELPAGADAALSCTNVRDHAAVLVDGRLAGFLDRRHPETRVRVPASAKARRLELVVEAMGRFNFGKAGLPFASKGILADVLLDGRALKGGWTFAAYPFEDIGSGRGLAYGAETALAGIVAQPASAVRIRFAAKGGADTWLDAGGWPHGLVWLNGRPLGRYWAIGPTRTMYVPGCWLKDGENELVVWDLKGFPACETLRFLDHPILDELHPERDLADFSGGGRLQGVDSAAEQIKSNVSGN